jgi:fucose 4-O-acetylase-like acetyltransferase
MDIERDRYVDALRAGSLFVVVLWHWVFTVVVWGSAGPHLSNPIGTTHGMWFLTWFLQVMPVFFFVGGFVNSLTWGRACDAGVGYASFVGRRLRRLLGPASLALAVGLVLRLALEVFVPDAEWVGKAIIALLSPLWFLIVYVGLVALTPVMTWLHQRLAPIDLVLLVGLVAAVDLLRFRFDVGWIAWANFALVWVFVHQLGFDYRRLITLDGRTQAAIALGGFTLLALLTNFGVYPRSMVGVPQEAISNMGPPTACIAALAVFQVGLVLLLRPAGTRWIAEPRVGRTVDWLAANSMTLFLWHTWGFALALGVLVAAGVPIPASTDGWWWVERPVYLLLPTLCTVPFWWFFRRFDQGLPSVASLLRLLQPSGRAPDDA